MSDNDPRQVIVVSNRGPVTFARADQQRTTQRGSGGLVSGLSALVGDTGELVWVCCPMSDEDRVVAAEQAGETFSITMADRDFQVRFVQSDPEQYERSYHVFANPLLWFLQHSMWDLALAPAFGPTEWQAFTDGYVPVNQAVAEAVADQVDSAGGDAVVFIHDYHLYLVAREVRKRCPDVILQHFVHIPWPAATEWRTLPAVMREAILLGLLGADIVAFHTERFAKAFLQTCVELLDLPVDGDASTVAVEGRIVRVCWYPISIDIAGFAALAQSPPVLARERQLRDGRRGAMILRVDRADPSKNVTRGFAAYDLLLRQHPELIGNVTFLALIQPTRTEIEQYRSYLRRIEKAAKAINHEFGTVTWQPVDLRVAEDLVQAVAAYRFYDVLFVNAVNDGLNLVAKEGVLANTTDGVLVLSENAGVHDELGAFVVSVNPFDLQGQADALHRALTMPLTERRDRLAACRAVVEHNDLERWFDIQLADIRMLGRPRPALGARG